jgi:hypothetical protein
MDPADLEWGGSRWASFLEGNDPDYATDCLAEDVRCATLPPRPARLCPGFDQLGLQLLDLVAAFAGIRLNLACC